MHFQSGTSLAPFGTWNSNMSSGTRDNRERVIARYQMVGWEKPPRKIQKEAERALARPIQFLMNAGTAAHHRAHQARQKLLPLQGFLRPHQPLLRDYPEQVH